MSTTTHNHSIQDQNITKFRRYSTVEKAALIVEFGAHGHRGNFELENDLTDLQCKELGMRLNNIHGNVLNTYHKWYCVATKGWRIVFY